MDDLRKIGKGFLIALFFPLFIILLPLFFALAIFWSLGELWESESYD